MTGIKRQAGLSLIEVLVSILVLGLALVSLAGLQSYTVKYQVGSSNRAVLSVLVSDFAERVRANVTAVPGFGQTGGSPYIFVDSWTNQAPAEAKPPPTASGANSADGKANGSKADTSAEGAKPAAAVNCEAVVCPTAVDLAASDLQRWRDRVRSELPQGSVRVEGIPGQPALLVTLMWQDIDLRGLRASNSSATCSTTAVMNEEQSRNCCPAGAEVPEGVRCANFMVVP